jgi:rod shape-determining protein MreB and related proteins
MLNKFLGLLSYDVGIDLGTANTMVLVVGKGILIKEPSVVARHKATGAILAIGEEAKRMVGKTPENIEAIRPLRDGVIADFDAAEAMLSYYIKKVHAGPGFWHRVPRPRVVVGIPSGVTEVERRAVQDAALSAGAREAYLIEEPMAAAIGAGLKVLEPEGRMMVDIGGGTAEIAIISLGGIVLNRSIRVAGDELDEAVTRFARMKHNLIIGETTAEQVKIAVGSAYRFGAKKTKNQQSTS